MQVKTLLNEFTLGYHGRYSGFSLYSSQCSYSLSFSKYKTLQTCVQGNQCKFWRMEWKKKTRTPIIKCSNKGLLIF